MYNELGVIDDIDHAIRVHQHAAIDGRAKDAVDGKTAVPVRIRGFHACGQIWALRSGGRRHRRLSGNRRHGIRQRDRGLRGGAQRENHTKQRESGDKTETTQHGKSPGMSVAEENREYRHLRHL